MRRALPFPNGLATLMQDRAALLGYLTRPYLLLYAAFLVTMVSLSFAIPGIKTVAMAIRWPVLGFVAFVGALLPLTQSGRVWTTVHKAMFLFIFLLAASAAYSLDREYSFQRAGSLALLASATGIGLYTYCRTWKHAIAVTDLMWCIGALLALAGLVFRAADANASGPRYEGLHNRATGAGTYAALFLPIAVYQASYRFRGFMKLVGWGVVALLLLQAALAGARMAAGMGVIICLTLGFAYNARNALVALIACVILAPVPFALEPRLWERVKEKADRLIRPESFGTFTGRLDRWKFGIEQWRRRPIFGNGFGTSRTLASMEDPSRFKLQPGETFNLHSDQIEVLMDVGVVGFLPFFVFWAGLLVVGLRAAMSQKTLQRQLALAYFGALFYAFSDTFMHGGFLAAGGGVSAFSWSMIALFLAIVPGQTLLAAPPAKRAPPPEPGIPRFVPNRMRPVPIPVRDTLPSTRRLGRRR